MAGSVGVSVAHYGSCGALCGTIAGIACPEGEFCDLDSGSCQVADAAGTCVPRPQVCPELYAPVCGCDGVTYGNDCERVAAGVTKSHDGECTCSPDPRASCATTCDCYAQPDLSLCPQCPLLCPNCGDYWQCTEGRCVQACGPYPLDVLACFGSGK